MADLKAQLELSADASGVETGVGRAKRSLADLGATASAAGKQASAGLSQAGDGGSGAATKIDRATQNIIGSIQRTTAALEAGSKTSSAYFATLAQQRGISTDTLKPFLDQLEAANVKTIAAGHGMEGFSFATAAAKRELLVLGHELSQGNFKNFGGSLLVLGERTGAASLLFSGFGASVLGVVGVLGAFAAASVLGATESTKLANALILSGNAAGATFSQLQTSAKSIGAITGSQGGAADALAQLAGSGAVAAQSLEKFGLVAVKLERDTGQAIDETVKHFVELGKSPVDASIKLNDSLHYLTQSTFAQIKSLQDQGKAAEAAAAAQNAYADAMLNRAGQIEGQLGLIERAWKGIAGAAKEGWNAMLNIGRESSLKEQLDKVNAQIAKGRQPFDASAFGGNAEARAQLPQNLALQASLAKRALLEDNIAVSAKASSDAVGARIKFDQDGDKYLSRALKMERDITQARNEGAAAGASQAEIEKRVADIRDSYAKKNGASPINVDRATLNSDLGLIKDALAARTDAYKNAQSIFDAQRSAGLVADAQYYEQERVMIELNEASQLKAIDAEIAARKAQKFSGSDAARQEIENGQAIAKLRTDRIKLLADDAAASQRLDIAETAAQKRREAGYLANEQAAQRAFDQTKRQYDLELSLAGVGSQGAAHATARAQISNKYANDLQSVNDSRDAQQTAGTFNSDAKAAYDAQVALIEKFKTAALAEYDGYYTKRRQQDADYTNGLSRASQNYIDNAGNVAKLTEDAFTRSFSTIEDALVTFATTGKLSFKDLANSIIADLVRIEAKAAISSILKYLTGAIGGSGGGDISGEQFSSTGAAIAGRRAGGGIVDAGSTYLVGEKGPELLTLGSQSGFVTSNGAMTGGRGSFTYAPVIQVDSRSDRAAIQRDINDQLQSGFKEYTAHLHAAGVI